MQPTQIYKPLWEYIPLTQYSRPTAPARETVRNGLAFLRRQFRPTKTARRVQQRQFASVPRYLLNHAAPRPDLDQVICALDEASHRHWDTTRTRQNVGVVVGPPGSNADRVVTSLAQRNGWQLVGPPSTAELLAGGETWMKHVTGNGNAPLIIPQLGKCFLRHHNGLRLIDRLLSWLKTTRRRCLIACDSWAWAYLSQALQIDVLLPTPLTLSPLDGARLQFWLPSLAVASRGRFVFRDASNGRAIFPNGEVYDDRLHFNAQPGQMESYGEWLRVGSFLKQLAAYGRGLPEVIWVLWRQCMQVRADVNSNRVNRTADGDKRYTVWVAPWSQIDLPQVPKGNGTEESVIMHALLIHGGSSVELLDMLLPYSPSQIQRVVHKLADARLLAADDAKTWQVTHLGYPVVRQLLENEGYLVDRF